MKASHAAAVRPAPGLAVAVQFVARRPWVPAPADLRKWARAAHAAGVVALPASRRAAHAAAASVCVRIVGIAASRRLDRDYRGKDKATNVLSFPASREERGEQGALGDLVVCAPVVATEARQQGKALRAHWAHMIVHGVLHLLGYDHVTARSARVMEGLEVEILRGFGYQDPYLPANSIPSA